MKRHRRLRLPCKRDGCVGGVLLVRDAKNKERKKLQELELIQGAAILYACRIDPPSSQDTKRCRNRCVTGNTSILQSPALRAALTSEHHDGPLDQHSTNTCQSCTQDNLVWLHDQTTAHDVHSAAIPSVGMGLPPPMLSALSESVTSCTLGSVHDAVCVGWCPCLPHSPWPPRTALVSTLTSPAQCLHNTT